MADKSDLDALDRLAAEVPAPGDQAVADEGGMLSGVLGMLGKADQYQQGMASRVTNAATAGFTDWLGKQMGASPAPEVGPLSSLVAEVGGGIMGGGPVGGLARAGARMVPGVAARMARSPRLAQLFMGVGENAAYGGARAAFEGKDIGEGAALGGAVAGAIGAPILGLGGASATLQSWALNRNPERTSELVATLGRKIGLEPTPWMLNQANWAANWGQDKITQMASASTKITDYLANWNSQIKAEVARIGDMIGTVTPGPTTSVGSLVKGSLQDMSLAVKAEAAEPYAVVREVMGNRPVSVLNLGALLRDLQGQVDDYSSLGSISQLRKVVKALRGKMRIPEDQTLTRGGLTMERRPPLASTEAGQVAEDMYHNIGLDQETTLAGMESTWFADPDALTAEIIKRSTGPTWRQVWDEIQGLYPDNPKAMDWDRGDKAAAQAWGRFKDLLRDETKAAEGEVLEALQRESAPSASLKKVLDDHGTLQQALDFADAKYSLYRGMFENEESEIGKMLLNRTIHPEEIMRRLTKDTTSLRRLDKWVREVTNDPAVVQRWHDSMAQWKLKQMLDQSMVRDPGIPVAPGEERTAFDYRKLKGQLEGLEQEYEDELLRYNPEVKQALNNLTELEETTFDARMKLHPSPESFGQTESRNVVNAGSSARASMKLVLSFLSGGWMANRYLNPGATNPFTGGTPAMLGITSPVINTMRRAAAGPVATQVPDVTAGTPDDSMSVLQQMPR